MTGSTARPSRSAWWISATLVAVTAWFAVALVLLTLSGLAGARCGWLWASAVYAIGALIAWASSPTRHRRAAAALVLVAAVAAGTTTAAGAVPTPGALRAEREAIAPASWSTTWCPRQPSARRLPD